MCWWFFEKMKLKGLFIKSSCAMSINFIANKADQENKQPELDLLSFEKLDRNSPELWPQTLPGLSDFTGLKTPVKDSAHVKWMKEIDKEDFDTLQELGNLNTYQLMERVKDLMTLAYQLGLEESNQMTRGRLLGILESKSNDWA